MTKILYIPTFLFLLYSLAQTCPEGCKCPSRARVDCQSARLTQFPADVPPDIQVLDLRNNAIQKISIENLKNLYKLDTLILTGNKIRHLDEVSMPHGG